VIVAGIDGGSIAVIVVGLFGLIGSVVAAIFNHRGMKKAARADEVAAAFEAYDELVKNLRDEVKRLREEVSRVTTDAQQIVEHERRKGRAEIDAYLERASLELERCESRCRECRAEVGDLLANLAALKAVVLDEVARAAATSLLETHEGNVAEATEVARVRSFLRHLPEIEPPEETTP
jgi:hypothetical protein